MPQLRRTCGLVHIDVYKRQVFDSSQVALLLPQNGELQVVASAGAPLSETQRRRVVPGPGTTTSLEAQTGRGGLLTLALTAAGRPVGLLVLSGEGASTDDREPVSYTHLDVYKRQIMLNPLYEFET